MSGIAITFFIIAAVVMWGGLIASIIYLARTPELDVYPDAAAPVDDNG